MDVCYAQKKLPVLRSGDVIIIGGSLAGVAAALEFAQGGKKVILVEWRTYLGREISATLSPWVDYERLPKTGLIKELVEAACVPETIQSHHRIPLHMDAVKTFLEDRLIDSGVEVIYAAMPVDLFWQEERLAGVVIGNKSGRQIISSSLLIDATETALLARLADFPLQPGMPSMWIRNIEFDQVQADTAIKIDVPEELGMSGNKVSLVPGYRSGLGWIECAFNIPLASGDIQEMTWLELETRQRCMLLASWLVHNAPGFEKAYLSNVAYELKGSYATPLDAKPEQWISGLGAYSTPIPNLWMLNPAARLDGVNWDDPTSADEQTIYLARRLLKNWQALTGLPTPERSMPLFQETGNMSVGEMDSPQRGRKYAYLDAGPMQVPVLAAVDVLVVGGGTSGAISAYAAAKEKSSTFVVEMNPGLGGTGTYGGVHSYWCGYRGGFVARVRKWVNQAQKELGLQGLKGYIPVWNMDCKAFALEREIRKLGAGFLYNTRVIGAVMDGNKVLGVVAATRWGPVAVLGKVTIDASGDGDVAAFAGAEFTYGSPRDHAVMWYSLPQFFKPGRNQNNFTSPVDISNIEDYNRALLSGRRRSYQNKTVHDHGIYVATRESRHIVGDITPTLTDQLLHRAWEDTVCFAFSNNDIKGQIYSEWFRIGLIPPHLEIEIPYRALLPKGLENLLVVGKAVSTTHDALPAIRMQPDFENLGGAGGLAAALATRNGKTPRQVNIEELRRICARYRLLPKRYYKRRLVRFKPSETELQEMIKQINAEKPLYSYSDMRLYKVFKERIPFVDVTTAGPKAIPLLEAELEQEKDQDRQAMLAQALALMGSPAGVEVLSQKIMQMLGRERLPERDFVVRQVDRYSPDQAAMPAAAYLLFSLGNSRDRRALPVYQHVVDLLAQVQTEDIWNQRKGTFYYVDAVCVGIEKIADPAGAEILKQLHGYAPFHGNVLRSGFQADYLLERAAYLELVIGRALARCAAPEGVVVLIDYLADVRALLAEQAHSELIAISGKDFGKDPAAWSQWLESQAELLQPCPWAAPSDAQVAWTDTGVFISEPE